MAPWKKSQLTEWFLHQLEQAWDDQTSGGAQVLGDRYLQWQGDELGLQLECSSNTFLQGRDALLPEQEEMLLQHGWRRPVLEDLPNFWQTFVNREELVDAARMLVAAAKILSSPQPLPHFDDEVDVGQSEGVVADRARRDADGASAGQRLAGDEDRPHEVSKNGSYMPLFEPTPQVWGLRGDIYAWTAMQARLMTQPLPDDLDEIGETLRRTLADVIGADDLHREAVYVEAFNHGGMSGGQVDLTAWRSSLLPLLLRRAMNHLYEYDFSDQPARQLAVEIAACREIGETVSDVKHPCRRIVALQGPASTHHRQAPEAWAGGLQTAKLLFLSSNPSLSEAGDSNSGDVAERYPYVVWPDSEIADFITRRFDVSMEEPHVVDDRFRRWDGELSDKAVPFWRQARKRASELLGYEADPHRDYVMTEVVRCKSKAEIGVAQAAPLCSQLYLDRTLELSPAPVVVVLGAHARDLLAGLPHLPDLPLGFGRRGTPPDENIAVAELGGQERLVVYLPHLTSMEKGGRSFEDRYGRPVLQRIRDVALAGLSPREYGWNSPAG